MASRNLVGIDVGSKFVKAVQVTETSGQYKVTEFGIAEVSPQVSIPDTVNELFSKKNFKTKRVVSAVSGRFVFVRYISMRVLLVAAKRTFIDEHVGILEGAGLQPAIVDVDSFALGNAYELSGMINPQAIA